VSDRYDDIENTQKLDEYATVDIKISRNITKFIKASLEIQDLFDESWKESYQWETPGRMVFGGLRIMF